MFDLAYGEIAGAVGKSPAAVRQIAHRARDHVAARRPRVAVTMTEQQEAVDRLLAAMAREPVPTTPIFLKHLTGGAGEAEAKRFDAELHA